MPIDTGNALGAKARFVLRPQESLNELTHGTAPGGTLGTTISTAGGLAYVPGTSQTTWTVEVDDLDPNIGNSFSIFWYGVLRDNVGSLLLRNSDASYGWQFATGAYGGGQLSIYFYSSWGGNYRGSVATVADGSLHSIIANYDDVAKTVEFFLDGTSIGSGPWTKDPVALNPASQAFSMYATSAKAHAVVTLQAFKGLLSSTERASLVANPSYIFTSSPVTLTGAASMQANQCSAGSLAGSKTLAGSSCTQSNASPGTAITQTSVSLDPYSRLRSILAAQNLHTWVQVNTNRYLDVQVPVADRQSGLGTYSHAAIIVAYSGFAWDHTNGNLLLWGGGHANYSGNELYIWNGSTGAWGLASLQSRLDSDQLVVGKDAPQSSHTYQNNTWLPNNQMFCTFGGAAAPTGGPTEERVSSNPTVTRKVGPWVFDLSKADPNKVGGATGTGWDLVNVKAGSNAWQHRYDMIDGNYPLTTINHVSQAVSTVSENGKDVCYFTMDLASGFPYYYRYQFGNIRAGERDTIAKIAETWNSVTFEGWEVLDSKRSMLYRNAITTGKYTSELVAFHLPTAAPTTQDTPIDLVDTSGNPFVSVPYGGVYDDRNDVIWLWSAIDANPGRLYYITIPAWDSVTGWASTSWVVTAVDPVGATPRGHHNGGVLGKIKYVPELGAIVGLDSISVADNADAGVWLFKTSVMTGQLIGAGSLQANTASTGSITSSGTGIHLAAAPAVQGNRSSTGRINPPSSGLPAPASRTLGINENRTLGVRS